MRLRSKPLSPRLSRTVDFVGDVHQDAYTARIAKVTADMARVRYGIPTRACVGDGTDQSTGVQDTALVQLLTDANIDWIIPGNHDIVGRTPEAAQTAFGMPGRQFVQDVAGIRLIFLTPDIAGDMNPLGGATWWNYSPYLTWLGDRLAETTLDCWIVTHYPLLNTVASYPNGETQSITNDPGGTFAVASTGSSGNDDALMAVLNAHSNARMWISGHTHTDVRAVNPVVTRNTGDPTTITHDNYTNLIPAPASSDFQNGTNGWSSGSSTVPDLVFRADSADITIASLAGKTNRHTKGGFEAVSTGWASSFDTNVTHTFTRDNTWSSEGSWSAHWLSTNNGATPTFSRITDVTSTPEATCSPGEIIALAVDVNVIQAVSRGMRVSLNFLDSGHVTLPGAAIADAFFGTGTHTFLTYGVAPPSSAFVQITIGHNASTSQLGPGETTEFYADNVRVVNVDWAADFYGYLKATNSTGSAQAARMGLTGTNRPTVTPGQRVLVAVDVDVVQKGAITPTLFAAFYDGSGTQTRVSWSRPLSLGRQIVALWFDSPWDGVQANFFIGYQTAGLANGETFEAKFWRAWILNMAGVVPPGTREIIALNVSSPAYTGTSNADPFRDKIVTFRVTDLDDAIEVRCRNHGGGNWEPAGGYFGGGARVATFAKGD